MRHYGAGRVARVRVGERGVRSCVGFLFVVVRGVSFDGRVWGFFLWSCVGFLFMFLRALLFIFQVWGVTGLGLGVKEELNRHLLSTPIVSRREPFEESSRRKEKGKRSGKKVKFFFQLFPSLPVSLFPFFTAPSPRRLSPPPPPPPSPPIAASRARRPAPVLDPVCSSPPVHKSESREEIRGGRRRRGRR